VGLDPVVPVTVDQHHKEVLEEEARVMQHVRLLLAEIALPDLFLPAARVITSHWQLLEVE